MKTIVWLKNRYNIKSDNVLLDYYFHDLYNTKLITIKIKFE